MVKNSLIISKFNLYICSYPLSIIINMVKELQVSRCIDSETTTNDNGTASSELRASPDGIKKKTTGVELNQRLQKRCSKQIQRMKLIGVGKPCPDEQNTDVNWFQRSTDRDYRQRLIPSQRIDLIYAHAVHHDSMKVISERFGIEKSTVSKVIKGFKEQGRM